MSATPTHFENVRDIVLTHAHLDHIAGLPLFIDDLFSKLSEPIRIHASPEVIEVLERDVFNWSVYPRFSELRNENGPVVEYHPFEAGNEFDVRHLKVTAVNVNHKVPTSGFIVSTTDTVVAMTGDTSEMNGFWAAVNARKDLSALLIECAFPNHLSELADISCHLTPTTLAAELEKFEHLECPIFVINLKPMYREYTLSEIGALKIRNLTVLEPGNIYDW